jgi:hypothetical protein
MYVTVKVTTFYFNYFLFLGRYRKKGNLCNIFQVGIDTSVTMAKIALTSRSPKSNAGKVRNESAP